MQGIKLAVYELTAAVSKAEISRSGDMIAVGSLMGVVLDAEITRGREVMAAVARIKTMLENL